MIALIQRVKQARVEVDQQVVGSIEQGLLVLLGVEKSDTQQHVSKLCRKVVNYRVFADAQDKMNLNVQQAGGQLLVVSQFTLVADTQSGNRPSFSSAAPPQLGQQLYNAFLAEIEQYGVAHQAGVFGADMQVHLQNDGPVTFQLKV